MGLNLISFLPPPQSGTHRCRPQLVYLPGMDGTGELIRPQLASLTGLADVHAVSIPPDDRSSWRSLLDQLAMLLKEKLGRLRQAPLVLCGESFGGCLALQLAAHQPSLLDGLVLINPATSAFRRPWIGWGADLVSSLPAPLYGLSAIGLLPLLIAQTRVSLRNQSALVRAMQSVTPLSAAWRLSLLAEFSAQHLPLEQVHQPVLLLASGSDRLLPSLEESDQLSRRLANAHTVRLPRSGHACLLEEKIRLGDILQPHLSGIETMQAAAA
jgi:pimeloyl-ACP methyl ester carboxylesterase